MDEIWKDIKGYEGIYQVSNIGRVRSFDRYTRGLKKMFKPGCIRKPFDTTGYESVALSNSGDKTFMVHRLVADAFIPNPKGLPCVNHIDGNKKNNVVSNLEWVTYSENTRHAIRIGLIDVEQSRINGRKSVEITGHPLKCTDSGEVFESVRNAYRRFGSDAFIIECLDTGKRSHKNRGFMFEYITREEYLDSLASQKDLKYYDSIYETIWNRCKHRGKAVPIYCIERKIQYPSVSAAARDNNMDNETIRLSIIENRKAKGLTFIRTDGGEF